MATRTSKRLWRGLDRARLRKLKHALQMILDRDDVMNQNPVTENTIFFFFIDEDDEALLAACNLVQDRIATCLDQRL